MTVGISAGRIAALFAGVAFCPVAWADDARVDFNRDVRPILSDNCVFCHGPDASRREAGLRLDLREGAVATLESGDAAVVPGDPDASGIVRRVASDDESERMPPAHSGKKPLTPAQAATLRRWVAQGGEYAPHWAYVPPARSDVPAVRDGAWPDGPIDRFILARLEAEGLTPSPEADRVTLIRRVTFDLTGLPPTPEQVDAFLADASPDAYERLVDRLLASPRFGERMAVHWLDLVRYADTVGYHGDQDHHIAPYRDYVLKSFNENLPFDAFTREQLAGDLLPDPTTWQRVATGYNRVLQTTHEGGAQDKEYLAKYAADRVRNASAVWLGATLGCAECHDHKYDPYTQEDFYRFAAYFADVTESGNYLGAGDTVPTKRPPEVRVPFLAQEARLREFDRRDAELVDRETRADGWRPLARIVVDRVFLGMERRTFEAEFPLCMVTIAREPRPIRVLSRGDWMDESGPVVEPGPPRFLAPAASSGRATRLDLANWLCSEANPLTARVFVNRAWELFFGRGLCGCLEDFGAQAEPPDHPELLDRLAVEFREDGWDVKRLVRRIVTSRAYRQGSLESPTLRERDPRNRLVARQGRFRLPAEFVRDGALAAGGLLVERLGGRSARPYQPAGYYRHLNFPTREYVADRGPDQYRRGVYVHWQRQFVHPMLRAFDAPSREECAADRPASNTPLAALALLNDPTFVEAARALAADTLAEAGGDEARLRRMWRRVVSREAESAEVAVLRGLLERDRTEYAADPAAAKALLSVGLSPSPPDVPPAELAAWTSAARALLNLNEAITRN